MGGVGDRFLQFSRGAATRALLLQDETSLTETLWP